MEEYKVEWGGGEWLNAFEVYDRSYPTLIKVCSCMFASGVQVSHKQQGFILGREGTIGCLLL